MRRRLLLAAAALLLTAQAAPPPPGGAAAPGTPSASDAWVPRNAADLIMLDKMRGQPTPVTVQVGQRASFGPLTVALRSCATRPPDLPQNAAAFLEVVNGQTKATLFRGWILANTPAVAQMEDPVFDMRLVTCR